jgi:predicted hydrocarbon binding protein
VDKTRPLPNYMMHFILTQLEGYIGMNGTDALLNYTGFGRLKDHYPPNDLNPGEPVATLTALVSGLMDVYGENGYRALLRDVGARSFHVMLQTMPWYFGLEDGTPKDGSPAERYTSMYRSAFEKASQIFGLDLSLEVGPDRIIDEARDCIWCSGLKTSGPICIFTEDFYGAMARWTGMDDARVVETHCMAAGDDRCRFVTTLG